jgi:hypothetical protein
MDKLQERWSLSSMGEEGEMKPVWANSKYEQDHKSPIVGWNCNCEKKRGNFQDPADGK